MLGTLIAGSSRGRRSGAPAKSGLYDGTPGVSGSPGYSERYCAEPRWTLLGARAGPCGYDEWLFEGTMSPSSMRSV